MDALGTYAAMITLQPSWAKVDEDLLVPVNEIIFLIDRYCFGVCFELRIKIREYVWRKDKAGNIYHATFSSIASRDVQIQYW